MPFLVTRNFLIYNNFDIDMIKTLKLKIYIGIGFQ